MFRPTSALFGATLHSSLHNDDREKKCTAYNPLPPGADRPFEVQQVENDAEEEHPGEGEARAPLTASEHSSADDNCGNRVKLPSGSGDRLGSSKASSEKHAGEPRKSAAQRVGEDHHAIDLETQQARGIQAVADGVYVSAESGVV